MGGFSWKGKDPEAADDFAITDVSYGFGQLVGWPLVAGRDFSKAFVTDSSPHTFKTACPSVNS
ncbi:hypothetical protein [Spirosoma koreense]